MPEIATRKVIHSRLGVVQINQQDFDPQIHKPWSPEAEAALAGPSAVGEEEKGAASQEQGAGQAAQGPPKLSVSKGSPLGAAKKGD